MTELPEIASIFKRDQQGNPLGPPEDLHQWTDEGLLREVWLIDRRFSAVVAELERRGLRVKRTFEPGRDNTVFRLARLTGLP
jgi:hypothetical protein